MSRFVSSGFGQARLLRVLAGLSRRFVRGARLLRVACAAMTVLTPEENLFRRELTRQPSVVPLGSAVSVHDLLRPVVLPGRRFRGLRLLAGSPCRIRSRLPPARS